MKAIAGDDYSPRAFFHPDRSFDGRRLVAWTSDIDQLKRAVYGILESYPDDLEVLLKVELEKSPDGDVWSRYHGRIGRSELVKAIRGNEWFLFQDGANQLCVRRRDTGEYFVLDEHDLIFIYGRYELFEQILTSFGFERREEPLITSRGHWHRTFERASKDFIDATGLQRVG